MDQFRAFSVYEDNPKEVDQKKREPPVKTEPFAVKDYNKDVKPPPIEETKHVLKEQEKVQAPVIRYLPFIISYDT